MKQTIVLALFPLPKVSLLNHYTDDAWQCSTPFPPKLNHEVSIAEKAVCVAKSNEARDE